MKNYSYKKKKINHYDDRISTELIPGNWVYTFSRIELTRLNSVEERDFVFDNMIVRAVSLREDFSIPIEVFVKILINPFCCSSGVRTRFFNESNI